MKFQLIKGESYLREPPMRLFCFSKKKCALNPGGKFSNPEPAHFLNQRLNMTINPIKHPPFIFFENKKMPNTTYFPE